MCEKCEAFKTILRNTLENVSQELGDILSPKCAFELISTIRCRLLLLKKRVDASKESWSGYNGK